MPRAADLRLMREAGALLGIESRIFAA